MDMTSPATSGRNLSKFEKKTVKNAASDDFGSNFSVAAFCLAQPIGGLLLYAPTTQCSFGRPKDTHNALAIVIGPMSLLRAVGINKAKMSTVVADDEV